MMHEDNEETDKQAEGEANSHKRHACKGCGEDCTSTMHHKKHGHSKAKQKALEKFSK